MKTILAWFLVIAINTAIGYLFIIGTNTNQEFKAPYLLKAFALSLLISSVLYITTRHSKQKKADNPTSK